MGTRSITRVYAGMPADKPRAVVQMYRHMDGYPSGHGSELAKFLAGMTVVNGLSYPRPDDRQANGAGCLAAQMVETFKNGTVGNIYLEPDGKNSGVDYKYSIFAEAGQPIFVRIQRARHVLFEGNVDEFTQYCLKEGNE